MATPVRQTASTVPAGTESPGNWKHPRLAEITRRRSQNIFSEKHIRQIVYNAAALVSVGLLRQVVLPLVPSVLISPVLKQYSGWVYATLVLVPLINIVFALLPLVRPQDDLTDIALTPAQRQLLGLPASPRPDTPNSVYSTPPRYSRTPSLAGSPASIKSYTSSPLSNMASPGSGRYSSPRFGTSPSKLNAPQYSPSMVSPLRHKAVGGGMNGARTSSFGSTSPLGASTASSVFGDGPATPTPAAGKRSSVSLNSKWLYEKGRRNSGNSWLQQN
ncbi:nuclear pore complex component-domain-containing protein [Chaetomidium leptoderma]|uniref:Nuclear pore complex component-domain-containing protein n=1 Tax=Chaetomidium leptoderma TaxID=669021 RepID=A0AAN6VDH6_9PEZI|nr:nuclear pore complex component-domain-containing protein [Chaetomidium leptoderma]